MTYRKPKCTLCGKRHAAKTKYDHPLTIWHKRLSMGVFKTADFGRDHGTRWWPVNPLREITFSIRNDYNAE